jgi:hypothetical protein
MQKVDRLCDVFSKAKYDLESAFHHEEREHKIKAIRKDITEKKELLKSTRSTLRKYLQGIQQIGRETTMQQKIVF